MKYWILTSEYPPYYGGGIGTYACHLARLLTNHGVEVSVFVPDRNVETLTEDNSTGIRVIRFSPYFADTSAFLGYEAMVSYSFAAIVEKYLALGERPDWIEAQEYNGIAYYLLQKKHLGYATLKNIRVIITCHCPSFVLLPYNHNSGFTLPGYWIGEMEKFCIEAAAICFSPSDYLTAKLKEAGIMRTDIRVLRNPYHSTAELENNVPLQDHLVYVGKVSPAKGILELMEAIQILRHTRPGIKLDIIGDDNFYFHSRKKLMNVYLREKYATLFNAGHVVLNGIVPASVTEKYIKQASLLVLPSKMENLPYVVVESMFLGTPVLATDLGGQAEIIEDGKNGFLYHPQGENILAQKIEAVLSMGQQQLSEVRLNAARYIRKALSYDLHYTTKMKFLETFNEQRDDTFPFPGMIESKKTVTGTITEEQPLLSVIIPFYNLGKYIGETVDSILASDYTNIEIIIMDDGSTDTDSIKVLEALSNRAGVKVVRQENQGLALTRNKGAAIASGRLISFLDADDKIDPAYYVKAVKLLMAKDNVHFVGCWVKYFEGSDKCWPSFTPVFPYILFHNMVNSSSLVYKKESFCKYGLNDERFIYGMEDYDSVISMMSNGCYGVVLPEFLFYYRVRKNSMSRGFNDSNQQYLYALLAKKHGDTLSKFASSLYALLNANGPGYKIENPTRSSVNYSSNGYINKVTQKLVEKAKQNPKIRSVFLKLMSKRG